MFGLYCKDDLSNLYGASKVKDHICLNLNAPLVYVNKSYHELRCERSRLRKHSPQEAYTGEVPRNKLWIMT